MKPVGHDHRHLRIAKLATRHRSALSVFLRQLDSKTTHDYTHFGYEIEKPADTTDNILEEIAHGRTVGYVLLDGNTILGLGHLDFFPKKEKRHVVRLGIVIHQRCQGRGLGRRLLDSMIEDATRMGIKKIWVATYADNRRALELYRSRGFLVEGVFRKEEKVQGRYRDVISMALFVDEVGE
jgi:ribosomal protein S18 acetylase RimI-like enzyme